MNLQKNISDPKVWIREVTFSDGRKVDLKSDDIVVLVGPNNSGKTVALKNIEQKAIDKASSTVVVVTLELSLSGDEIQLCNWLERNSRKNTSNASNPTFTRMGASVGEIQAKSWWNNHKNGLHDLARFFVYLLTTDARLATANPAPNISLARDPLTHPIHYLQRYDYIEEKVSSYFKEAFGVDLVLNRNAGNKVPLHCGIRPKPKEDEDRLSSSYFQELEKLPTLQDQGDGMRSFVGVLLHSLVVNHTVIMIDEPDAFLHPPQARLLGQMLVKEAPQERQLFLATHSGDFLRGLLDTQSDRVRIIRIQRNNNINPVKELDNSGIKKVWRDPILRYSNVLDGIFHNQVVLCESDGDCRFYAAIMDAIIDESIDIRREDIMFLHCGGKDRMPTVVNSLRNLDVPVQVITDFDVLNNEKPLKIIIEALGINWRLVESNWRAVKKAIENKKPELSTTEVNNEIREVLDSIQEDVFPSDAKKKIQGILRRSSPWSTAKNVGPEYIPRGDPTVAYNTMRDELEKFGFFIVPVGELEGFVPSIGGEGPKWVNKVLERDLSRDPELETARKFVKKIIT